MPQVETGSWVKTKAGRGYSSRLGIVNALTERGAMVLFQTETKARSLSLHELHPATLAPHHVCADDRCVDAEQIFGRALAEIKANGVDDSRIAIKVMTSANPARTILHEADQGKYAAVAIGRTSHKPSSLGHIFATTSLKILRGIDRAALWLCK